MEPTLIFGLSAQDFQDWFSVIGPVGVTIGVAIRWISSRMDKAAAASRAERDKWEKGQDQATAELRSYLERRITELGDEVGAANQKISTLLDHVITLEGLMTQSGVPVPRRPQV